MWTIAVDDPGVCMYVRRLRCANVANRIEVLLGVETFEDPRNISLDGGSRFPHGYVAAFGKLLWQLVIHAVKNTFLQAMIATGQ